MLKILNLETGFASAKQPAATQTRLQNTSAKALADQSNLSHWKQGGYLDTRNRSASVKSLASVRSTAPAPPRKACFHRNPNLIEPN